MQELAATIDEISNKVNQNADSARQASKAADCVRVKMNVSKEKMQQMTHAMGDISSCSSEISKIMNADLQHRVIELVCNAPERDKQRIKAACIRVLAGRIHRKISPGHFSKETILILDNKLKLMDQSADDAAAESASLYRTATLTMTAVVIAIILTGVFFSFVIIRLIKIPISEIENAAIKMAEGEFPC